ncbi:MAG TPA: prolyl oligopeptidase family serine peptidase [Chthoniobacter sp.]|nr:prolyl oligopeptidase family serine peptidase [Chthoniobacter sp.]
MKTLQLLLPLALAPALLFAQSTPTSKQAPPPGIEVPAADAAELKTGLDALGKDVEALQKRDVTRYPSTAVVADVEIFHKAVRYAAQYNEFFKAGEIGAAKAQLKLGQDRAKELLQNKASWSEATGPLVLGYYSKIDGSAQPYGLIVPDDWKPGDKTPRPLYLWFHGRGDTLSEVNFIAGRLKGKHDFSTANAFELHLYGRYCNASKFAGEVDCFEAMADVQRRYSIDPNRIVEMGFSMGGATGWHMAAHHPGLWAVGSSGAGFAETAIYAKVDDAKKVAPTPLERKMYSLYDCDKIAANYGNLPFIAYSGEIDPQKQSADLMNKAMEAEGVKMEWLIGPGVGHKYEPETKKELSKRIDAYVAKGREPLPPHIRFQTYSLRYNECKWLTLDALEQHWEKAEVDARLVDEGTITIKTKNVAAFTIAFPAGPVPLDKTHPPRVLIDDSELVGPAVKEGWSAHFQKTNGKWAAAAGTNYTGTTLVTTGAGVSGFTKHHGLQGPVDDAFMDSFIFVRPTGKALNDKVGAWAQSEFDLAIAGWRRVFRGDVRVKDDTAITPQDMANANLVLWGDPGSNKVLAQMLKSGLPIQWTKDKLTMGSESTSAADHAPIMIFPNPLNPNRYIVLNSGFTFRMGARVSNSLQTPKLPDWALIDLNTAPNELWPGKVVNEGFFDERWQWTKK